MRSPGKSARSSEGFSIAALQSIVSLRPSERVMVTLVLLPNSLKSPAAEMAFSTVNPVV